MHKLCKIFLAFLLIHLGFRFLSCGIVFFFCIIQKVYSTLHCYDPISIFSILKGFYIFWWLNLKILFAHCWSHFKKSLCVWEFNNKTGFYFVFTLILQKILKNLLNVFLNLFFINLSWRINKGRTALFFANTFQIFD